MIDFGYYAQSHRRHSNPENHKVDSSDLLVIVEIWSPTRTLLSIEKVCVDPVRVLLQGRLVATIQDCRILTQQLSNSTGLPGAVADRMAQAFVAT